MINFDALRAAEVQAAPYTHFSAENVITNEQAADIRRDYPDITKSGYLPLTELKSEGEFAKLITDLQSVELADILSDKLSLDLADKPRMITVRKVSKKTCGRIHTDGKAKLCTMLIYLNESWDNSEGGAIRVFETDESMDKYEKEVAPIAGNVFAFRRADNSWHGHPPFEGIRYVVQVTFLQDEKELQRKQKRGVLQFFLKLFNPLAK